jgi:exopolysaccharide production protein ExoZ
MITNIQLLRGLAALAVVLLHTEFKLFGVVSTQFQGVSIFFVISGFIVAYITRKDTSRFLERRFIRIVPVYWAVLLFSFFWLSLGGFTWLAHFLHEPKHAIYQFGGAFFNHQGIHDVLMSMVFLPYKDSVSGAYGSFIYTGWTLNIELFFYTAFAFLSLLGRRAGILLTSLLLGGLCYLNMATATDGVLVRFYGQEATLYIVGGFLTYKLWEMTESWATKINPTVLRVIGGCVAVLLVLMNTVPLWDRWGIYGSRITGLVYMALPLLVVFTALFLHSAGLRWKWRPLLILGDISYVLYLSHVIVLTTMKRYADSYPFLDPKNNGTAGIIFTLALCVGVAWLLHVAVEKPLISMCDAWVRRWRALRLSPTSA